MGRKSQFNYEAGKRQPDAEYLAQAAGLGMDVRYVITGSRDYEPPEPLSADEYALLAHWRAASYETRKAAMGALVGASTRGSAKMQFRGPVGAIHNNQGTTHVQSTMNVTMPAKLRKRDL